MRLDNTTIGSDLQISLLQTFADILELATAEPGSMDEMNEILYSIQDKAASALPKGNSAFEQLLGLARTFRATCEDRLSVLRGDEKSWRGEEELADMIGHYESLLQQCDDAIDNADAS